MLHFSKSQNANPVKKNFFLFIVHEQKLFIHTVCNPIWDHKRAFVYEIKTNSKQASAIMLIIILQYFKSITEY